jgi:hypothetical protein
MTKLHIYRAKPAEVVTLPTDLKSFGHQERESQAADFWAAMIFIASIFSVIGFIAGALSR